MTTKLNRLALEHARKLINAEKVVRDERDAWSEADPSASQENNFIEKHGFDDYASWHLGIDTDAKEATKSRYSFPFGDFSKVRRSGVIAVESRAAQNDHDDIARAAKQLLELIDEKKN